MNISEEIIQKIKINQIIKYKNQEKRKILKNYYSIMI